MSIVLWGFGNSVQNIVSSRDRNQTQTLCYSYRASTYRKTLFRLIFSFKSYGTYRGHDYGIDYIVSRTSALCDSLRIAHVMEQDV